jgi:UDP-N-acetylmuramoyl-L-alanyl-D-glutamate--2,6-diaminopimelate ligase
MRERHMRHLVMEVSSHAMVLNRVRGCFFSVVAFTNLTQDHLDFHGDMESYFQAKASLFTPEYAEHGYVSIDTPYGLRLAENSKIAITTVSRLNPKATWHFAGLRSNAHGSEIKVRGVGGILIESNTSLVGSYNLDNLLLAVAIAYECGIDPIELSQIIPTLKGAPGRLDSVDVGQEFKALVDYAHSPDAVENVLRAAREFTSGKIIAILGCGGDRDRTKRPLMGMALSKGADIAIFTSDNPRSENPSEILNEMTFGLGVSGPSRIIEDRAAAIQYAVSIAKAGDTVLVLGKGHELGQESMGNITPFDDRLQLAQAIEARS